MRKSYWTRKRIVAAAKKCKTRSEFARKFDAAYRIAKRDSLDEAFLHLRPTKTWNVRNVLLEAKKYKSRNEFKLNSKGAYSAALRLGILNKACRHMEVKYNHWTPEAVFKLARKFKTKYEFLKKSRSAYRYAVNKKIINKVCAHMKRTIAEDGYWNFRRVLAEAKKFRTRSEFKKSSEVAYQKVLRKGWERYAFSHMERVGNLHLRAVYVFEFADRSAYVGITSDHSRRFRQHLGLESKNTKHRTVLTKIENGIKYKFKPGGKWFSKDKIGREELRTIAIYEGRGWTILNRAKAGALGGGFIRWTKEECKLEAKKFQSRIEWQKNGSKSAYNAAHYNGWLDDICGHMTKRKWVGRNFWTKERCLYVARKCISYREFRLKHRGAYQAVKTQGWNEDVKAVFLKKRKAT